MNAFVSGFARDPSSQKRVAVGGVGLGPESRLCSVRSRRCVLRNVKTCALKESDAEAAAVPTESDTEQQEKKASETVVAASSGSQPAPPSSSSDEVPFEIRGFSLANVGVVLGLGITAYSFYGYFSSSGTASGTSLGFVYGVPVLLIGLALKYAELKPVPVASSPEGLAMRDSKATETQKKIVKDVTRHRYGDEAHLDTALKALGLIPRGAACPELLRLTEQEIDGEYALGMEFFSKETPYSTWEQQLPKYERFFGPNVRCEVQKLDDAKRLVELKIITTSA